MIDFACKSFKLERIVRCGLGLSIADFKVLEYMLQEDKEYTTSELAKLLKFNLSTIQRSAKKLSEKDLIGKYQNNLDNGGYIFIYKIKSKKDVKNKILDIVHNWVKQVEKELDKW